MLNANLDMLRDAIARNAAMVLSLPSAGILRHCKSRFLADDDERFWVEAAPGEAALIDELIRSQHPAGISFRSGITKVVFTTQACARQSDYRINSETVVEAVQMRFPEEIKAVQRRNNYRVHVSQDSDLKVRVWRIGPGAYLRDRPMAAQEVPVELRDVSVGGIGIIVGGDSDGKAARISVQDRLRVQIDFRGATLLLEARLRYPEVPAPGQIVRAGVQFKALTNDMEGRQTLAKLTRLVGEMQREEVRHYWLGLSKPA